MTTLPAKIALRTLQSLLIGTYFTLCVAVGAVAHLGTPVSKTATARILERFLNSFFRGTFEVAEVSRLFAGNVSLSGIKIFDPDGRLVLSLSRLDTSVDPIDIVRRTVAPFDKLSIEIQHISAAGLTVHLLPTTTRDPSGRPLNHLSLVDAFELAEAGTQSPSKKTARPLRIWMPKILLKDAQADGSVAGSPVMQTQVERAMAQILITNKGFLLDINRFGLRASGLLGVDAQAQGDVHVRVPGAVYGKVSGSLGEIPMEYQFRVEQSFLEVQAELPRLQPSQLRPVLGSWPLDETIAVHATAKGKLPELAVQARVAVLTRERTEAFEINANGTLNVARPLGANLQVETHDLDLSRLIHSLPRSRLSSETQLKISLDQKPIRIEANTRLVAGSLGERTLPPLLAKTTIVGSEVQSNVVIDQPHLRLSGHLTLKENEPLELSADIAEVSDRSEYVKPYIGAIKADIKGRVEASLLENGQIAASANLISGNVVAGPARLSRAEIRTTVTGHRDAPLSLEAETKVEAKALSVSGVFFKEVNLEQSGTISSPRLALFGVTKQGHKFELKTDANLVRQSASHLRARFEGDQEPITLETKLASFRNGRLIVEDFELKSIGAIRGNIDMTALGGHIDLTATQLDLARIGQHLGLHPGELEGKLSGQINLDLGDNSQGSVELSLRDGGYRGLVNITGDLKTQIEGDRVTGNTIAQIPGLAIINSQLDARVPGRLMNLDNWRAASGSLKTRVTQIDLKTLSLLAGLGSKVEVSGQGQITLDIARAAGAQPTFTLGLDTKDLGAILEVSDGPAIVLRGVEINSVSEVLVDESSVESAFRLQDSRGTLLSVSGHIDLPVARWWESPPSAEKLIQEIRQAELDVVALLVERKVSQIPGGLNLPLRSGRAGARIAISGSLDAPELVAVITGQDLLLRADTTLVRPLDVRINARYSASSGMFVGNAHFADDDRSLAAFDAELNIPMEHVIYGGSKDVPFWTGSARAQLESFPLDLLRVAVDNKVRGQAEGVLTITRSDFLPQIDSKLRLRHLVAGKHDIGDAAMELKNRGPKVTASAQVADDFGELQATAELTLAVLEGGIGLSKEHNVLVKLNSDKYNAAAAAPFLKDVFDELAGPLKGQLELELTPPRAGEPSHATIRGEMVLTSGTLRPTAVGVRMEDVSFHLEASPEDGLNVLRLSELRARVASKAPNLTGRAVVRLRDLSPHSGEFYLSADDLAVTQGVTPLATVTGTLSGQLLAKNEALFISVEVPALLAELAEGADDQLIDLEENQDITVIQAPQKKTETAASASLPVHLKVALGQDVRIKNSLVDVRLGGTPEITLGEKTSLAGGIDIKRGSRFVVLGRSFLVDRGLIVFDTGDMADPHLQVGATWAAPNNVVVRLDVGGTLSAPTLTWSSEPSLREEEILALVIGGGGASGNGITQGASIALVANELSNIEGLEFYSTQQTSTGDGRVASLNDTSWDSYTASYQINDKLWFEGSLKRQTSGASHDVRNGFSGTLDWRFHPQWALRSEVGTLGMGLDVLWQYRY